MQQRYARAILELNDVLAGVDTIQSMADRLQAVIGAHMPLDWVGFFSLYQGQQRINVTTNEGLPFCWDDHYAHLAQLDPLGQKTMQSRVGAYLFFQKVYNPRREADAFVCEYIRRHTDTTNGMVTPLFMNPGEDRLALALFRSAPEEHFGRSEQAYLEHCLPLIRQHSQTMLIRQQLDIRNLLLGELLASRQIECSILVDNQLRIISLPEKTAALLAEYCAVPHVDALPAPLRAWLKARRDQGGLCPGSTLREQVPLPGGMLECTVCCVEEEKTRYFWLCLRPVKDSPDFSGLENHGLTRREAEVISYLPLGFTNTQIARALGVEEVTVKKHLMGASRKLGVSGRVEVLSRSLQLLAAA